MITHLNGGINMNNLYSYNRYTNTTTNEPFAPSGTNWLISASKAGNTTYFNNVSSYNNWANTCCGESASNILSGSYNGHSIKFNKF